MNPAPVHGGNVHAAARETGRRLDQLVDFSASINPLGPSPRTLRAVVRGMREAVHYPDPDCLSLREALAARHGLSADRFLIGNGSSELIALLPAALSIHHALVVGPTFSEYANAVTIHGGRVTAINARRADGYRPPIERVVDGLRAGDLRLDAVFLCNPNSPTGQAMDGARVFELARAASRRNLWTVVDETFVDYCEQRSVLSKVAVLPRLLILRTFTKFYALPGLRIGYLAASRAVVEAIRKQQPPWSVNALAQAAARTALRDRTHARRSLAFMELERARLTRGLSRLPDVTVYRSETNFLLAELPRATRAPTLAKALRRQGLLIRDCSSVEGLTDRTIRIAVRTRRQNRVLLAALRDQLTGRKHEA